MYSLHYGETGILLKKSLQITEPFVKLQNTFRGHVFSCQSESRAGHLSRTRPGKLRSQKLAAGPRWRVTFRWLCRAWRGGAPRVRCRGSRSSVLLLLLPRRPANDGPEGPAWRLARHRLGSVLCATRPPAARTAAHCPSGDFGSAGEPNPQETARC